MGNVAILPAARPALPAGLFHFALGNGSKPWKLTIEGERIEVLRRPHFEQRNFVSIKLRGAFGPHRSTKGASLTALWWPHPVVSQ